ncbi:MAG: aldo/keto reductase [Nitrospinota bacterium]
MRYRTLGRTGLRVGEVGMGTWQTFDARDSRGEAHVARLVEEALARGVNLFDTAPMYGESERVLGLALRGRRERALVATKVLEYDPASARASIERSFRLLQTEVIDLMQVHNMAGWKALTPLLREYKDSGRVRFLGLTNYRPSMFPEMARAMRTGAYDAIQIPFSLGEREAEREVLPLARELGLGVLVMTPLCPMWDRQSLLRALGRADLSFLAPYGVRTPARALLKYVLSNPDVSAVLPATSKLEHLAENVGASEGESLPLEVRRRLEKLLG